MHTESHAWRRAASCATAGVDPELFFPIDTGPAGAAAVAVAKRVCAGCPVRAECLADVMAIEDPAERFGVTGGLSADERTELFARDRGPAVDVPAPAPLVTPPLPPVPVPVVVGVQLDLFDLDESVNASARKGAA